ncbi:MAG: hypothetical protein J7539_06415 [Niabella sp.]|nr:hypothetical protein [Niabella sp.]
MKRTTFLPIIALLLFVLLFFLFRKNSKNENSYSTFISLKKEDKNPYGTYVTYNSLQQFFPGAVTKINDRSILTSTAFYQHKQNQFFVSITPQFNPTEEEMDELLEFVNSGNCALISCFMLGSTVEEYIDATIRTGNMRSYPYGDLGPDSMSVELDSIPLPQTYTAAYPGVAVESSFSRTNHKTTRIIGRGRARNANFIELKKGKGSLFLQLAPLAFSNYFLLYHDNINYLSQVLSLVPQSTTTLIWDDYYRKKRDTDTDKNWFSAIMKDKAFSAGILLALALLLIFTLLEMRRRQRFIPVIEAPKNDTLDFVKTMGLLYYEKRDNVNLAQKMSAYFQEYLRNKYHIFSKQLNNDYIRELSDKSGADPALVSAIIKQIKTTEAEGVISDADLITLQANIEKFYTRS